jgi:DNA adenine methylase
MYKKPAFKPRLRPPITYHMGKNMMARHILPMFPAHHCYCEPFAGSAALFFAKEPVKVEVLNDLNDNLMTFYKVAKETPYTLYDRIRATPYSGRCFQHAKDILLNPSGHSDITRAWAVFTVHNMAMYGDPKKSFKISKRDNVSGTYMGKKQRLTAMLGRLDKTVLECRDALKVIKTLDAAESFFFIDPPYFNSGVGTENYARDDFINLIDMLAGLQGKFLLTCYDNELVRDYTSRQRWHTRHIKRKLAYGAHSTVKTEVITTNYIP